MAFKFYTFCSWFSYNHWVEVCYLYLWFAFHLWTLGQGFYQNLNFSILGQVFQNYLLGLKGCWLRFASFGIRKGEALLFFWFFKNCELIRDSSLWRSNFIALVRDSIVIIGSRSVYTFGSRFTYKLWVKVPSKIWILAFLGKYSNIFVGSQSVFIEVRIIIDTNWDPTNNIGIWCEPQLTRFET